MKNIHCFILPKPKNITNFDYYYFINHIYTLSIFLKNLPKYDRSFLIKKNIFLI